MLDLETTVARAVLDHSECAPVFQRHRIDYCCQGQRSIASACADRGVDAGAVLAELERAIAERRGDAGPDAANLSTDALIDHVVGTHHVYLRRALPFVGALAAKVARVHGDRDPRLVLLGAAVRDLVDGLLPHLDDEEASLFPALRAGRPGDPAIVRQLAAMEEEHLAVGGQLGAIRGITGDFALPAWACTSYRTLFAELEQLEADTLRHVHLENHGLAPRFVG